MNSSRALHTPHNLAGNGARYTMHRNKVHLPRRMTRRRCRHLVVHLARRHRWLGR